MPSSPILEFILIATGLGALGLVGWRAVRARRKRIEAMPDESGDAHLCQPGTFSARALVESKRLAVVGNNLVQILIGVYCSACGHELCCESCGKTPPKGTIVPSLEAGERAARCCPKPAWARRVGGAVLDPSQRARLPQGERLRWN